MVTRVGDVFIKYVLIENKMVREKTLEWEERYVLLRRHRRKLLEPS